MSEPWPFPPGSLERVGFSDRHAQLAVRSGGSTEGPGELGQERTDLSVGHHGVQRKTPCLTERITRDSLKQGHGEDFDHRTSFAGG